MERGNSWGTCWFIFGFSCASSIRSFYRRNLLQVKLLKELIIFLIIGIAFATPSCPYYPYRDYTAANQYASPQRPLGSLTEYCTRNNDQTCLWVGFLNNTQDKNFFISELIANNSFEKIRNWNQNISFGKWFNNSRNATNIKDAWISIAYIDPPVYDNETYLVNTSSIPLIKYNFTFVVDTSRSLGSDCRDNYLVCGYDYSITNQSNNSLLNFTLNVRSEYLVDRYRWVRYCNRFGCWLSCDYYRTDSFRDSLRVSDSKKVKYENFSIDSNYSISVYNDLADIRLNINNSNIHFQMGNSTFDKSNYYYKIRIENEPYNVLVKELIYNNKTSAYGLSILEQNNSSFRLLVPYYQNCSLTVLGYFNSFTNSNCSFTQLNNSVRVSQSNIRALFTIDQLFQISALLLVFYFLYEISKKVIKNA